MQLCKACLPTYFSSNLPVYYYSSLENKDHCSSHHASYTALVFAGLYDYFEVPSIFALATLAFGKSQVEMIIEKVFNGKTKFRS